MNYKIINKQVSVSEQVSPEDLEALQKQGVEILVCNRPDGEAANQPDFAAIKSAAEALGIDAINIPFKSGELHASQIAQFAQLLQNGKRLHAYCRTGNRSSQLWAHAESTRGVAHDTIIQQAATAGFDVAKTLKSQDQSQQAINQTHHQQRAAEQLYDVVIVGAGSGGIALASSLKKRRSSLRVALIDPAEVHYYQPGWTMVGGGVFAAETTKRQMQEVIPSGCTWIKQAVTTFAPEQNRVQLQDGSQVHYQQLVVAPGLKLDWAAVEGLEDTLGQHGVTSNYRYDLAPYTWQLVQDLKQGTALFTQPPMPIKCAGAPQKALYLSADHWYKHQRLKDIKVEFCNAGGVLFGVGDYVPALQRYIDKYSAQLHFFHNLVRVDGPKQTAWFTAKNGQGEEVEVEKKFAMLHVCPPQCAPDFVKASPLADENGWLAVDAATLQHTQHKNIWGIGDCLNTTNAKTMAAVRKQVPVVAENLCAALQDAPPAVKYEGYGSCPLTVERGKIVLAEFKYGGELDPTFPNWLNQGTQPTRFAWWLKEKVLPRFYWHGMLKGREWLARPNKIHAE